MAGLNIIQLIGHVGKGGAELRYTQGGTPVANFSVATSERWKDKEGDAQERTEWHRIVAWGKLAEICGQWLVQGKQVYIQGKMQYRTWEDKEGVKRTTAEVVAMQMQMLGKKGDTEGEPQHGGGQPQGGGGQPQGGPPPVMDDDIPF
jgi:single-strand DNA-binding protein